jgi:hypothetical protein
MSRVILIIRVTINCINRSDCVFMVVPCRNLSSISRNYIKKVSKFIDEVSEISCLIPILRSIPGSSQC